MHTPMDRDPASQSQSLEGQFLIAMPGIGDDRFSRTVIYMCAHTDEGAMGLVINQEAEDLSYATLLSKLEIISEFAPPNIDEKLAAKTVHIGGPVGITRGFVLHSRDYYSDENTLHISDGICLTSTLDVIKAIADGAGPKQSLTAIGYSGWGPGQLEHEIQRNGWLTCPADKAIVFENDVEIIYERTLSKMGIDPAFLAHDHGHA